MSSYTSRGSAATDALQDRVVTLLAQNHDLRHQLKDQSQMNDRLASQVLDLRLALQHIAGAQTVEAARQHAVEALGDDVLGHFTVGHHVAE